MWQLVLTIFDCGRFVFFLLHQIMTFFKIDCCLTDIFKFTSIWLFSFQCRNSFRLLCNFIFLLNLLWWKDARLLNALSSGSPDVIRFLTIMAVCNTVIPVQRWLLPFSFSPPLYSKNIWNLDYIIRNIWSQHYLELKHVDALIQVVSVCFLYSLQQKWGYHLQGTVPGWGCISTRCCTVAHGFLQQKCKYSWYNIFFFSTVKIPYPDLHAWSYSLNNILQKSSSMLLLSGMRFWKFWSLLRIGKECQL